MQNCNTVYKSHVTTQVNETMADQNLGMTDKVLFYTKHVQAYITNRIAVGHNTQTTLFSIINGSRDTFTGLLSLSFESTVALIFTPITNSSCYLLGELCRL